MDGFWVIDTEGDGLQASKIHVFSAGNREGVFSTKDYDKIRGFLTDKKKTLIGHNIIMWDIPTLERILGIKIECRLIDTLAISYYLYPLQKKHGLGYWGEVLGIKKPEVEDWHNLSYEEYKHRCEEDVKINIALWKKFWLELYEVYGSYDECMRFIKYLSFKMNCLRLQEKNKWKIDTEHVKKSIIDLEAERQPKFERIENSLPPVPIYKKKNYPKKMYKKDGSFSAGAFDWFNLLKEEGFKEDYTGEVRYVSGYKEPSAGSTQQIKDWLFSLGWVPDLYKDDVPQINKPHGQGLADSILELAEDYPIINELADLSVLNHRIPFLNGLLNSVDEKGYTVAGAAGFTNTLRLKHRGLVNLPKAGGRYADPIRSSLVCEEDEIQIGSDLSSLEDRIKQHFMFKFDPKAVEEMDTEGYDPHLKLAATAGVITNDQMEEYVTGVDQKTIKPIRNIFKNGNYALKWRM